MSIITYIILLTIKQLDDMQRVQDILLFSLSAFWYLQALPDTDDNVYKSIVIHTVKGMGKEYRTVL